MKIKEIEFKNHKILGNLKLDFTDINKNPYKKVIIVGENGCGKSTVLRIINQFLDGGGLEFNTLKYVDDFDNEWTIKEIDSKNSEIGYFELFDSKQVKKTKVLRSRLFGYDDIKNSKNDIRKHGSIYSYVNVNFKTESIKSSTSQSLNQDKQFSFDYNFTNIKQLLIDIGEEDNEMFARINENTHIEWCDFKKYHSKLEIFRKAFNNFFDELKFINVVTIKNEKNVLFKKNGADIYIDELSTGEKQIIFRGAYILKDIEIHKDGIVLIDEPELSMHPKWQDKILDYYFNIVFSRDAPASQSFVASHSENILRRACELSALDKNTLILELKYNAGMINAEKIENIDNAFLTYSDIKYQIFHIITPELYILKYEECLNEYIKIDPTASYKQFDDYLFHTYKEMLNIGIIRCKKRGNLYIVGSTDLYQTELTRLRHLLAHGFKNESNYLDFLAHNSTYDEGSKKFYDELKKDLEKILKNNFYKIQLVLENLRN